MKSDQLTFRPGLRVSIGNARSQAAGDGCLRPAVSKAGRKYLHQGADQWLLVIEGSGAAIINGHKTALKPGKNLADRSRGSP